jgi:hypothetical protein
MTETEGDEYQKDLWALNTDLYGGRLGHLRMKQNRLCRLINYIALLKGEYHMLL